jgi:hypothetical protein
LAEGGKVQVGGGQLSARVLDASYGPELQEINRACPIVSGLTFWFDRGDDFFRWPGLVYDRFFYVGVFSDGDLVGYCMAGLTRAWTGGDLGWALAGLRFLARRRVNRDNGPVDRQCPAPGQPKMSRS